MTRYFTYFTPLYNFNRSALIGAFLNLGIMFWLSWYSAAVSIVALFAIWLFIYFKGPQKSWGDVTQAIIYHQVRKFLLKLGEGDGILLCVFSFSSMTEYLTNF